MFINLCRLAISRRRIARTFAYSLCLAFLVTAGCQKNANDAAQSGGAAQNKGATRTGGATATGELPAASLTASAALLDGGTMRLNDYKGKVVVLDMWATWCPPCRAEIPHLVEIQREYGERVEVIGLTTEDAATTTGKVKAFAEQFNINYKVGFAAPEHKQLVVMGGGSIPQTFVINGEGRVVKHFPGFHPTQTIPAMRQAIEQALAKAG